MINSTSFTGIYIVNGPSARKVAQTVTRIKQECSQQQIDCDAFVEQAKNSNKKMIVFTEGDAELCRQNKSEYMSYAQKVKEIVENEPDDINKQMALMPKTSANLNKFLSQINDLLLVPNLNDNTVAINKDLDEGSFDIVNGKGPNLRKEYDRVFKSAINALFDSLKK